MAVLLMDGDYSGANKNGLAEKHDLQLINLLGHEKEVEISPFLKGLIGKVDDMLKRELEMRLVPETEHGLAAVCVGTSGTFVTKAELDLLKDISRSLGVVKFKRNDGFIWDRDARDLIDMRRELSVGLLSVVIVNCLSRRVYPFEPSSIPYRNIAVPSFIFGPDYFKSVVMISQIYHKASNGDVYSYDRLITVDEGGINVMDENVFSKYGSRDYPRSQLVFESLDLFTQWCEENGIVEKYRELEKKIYPLVIKAWLRDLPRYQELNGIDPEMNRLKK